MIPNYVIRRSCLKYNRPKLIDYLTVTFFPNMAKTEVAAAFPGAGTLIDVVKESIVDYGEEHGLHHTVAANLDWTDIKDETSAVFDYIDLTAGNDPTKIELTGLPIAIPAGHGSPEPRTGRVTNVRVIAEGGLLYRAEYEADEYAHHFTGRTKLHSAPESAWFEEGESQNHTMYFTGKQYPHGSDVDVEILSSGTQGSATEWSIAGTELIK
jgi:hypothetical protein